MRRSAIRDYQIGEHKNPPHPFNVAPTLHSKIILNVSDYGFLVLPTDIIEGNFFKLFIILLFMFYFPSFRFSSRLRVLWLLSLRSLLLSLRRLNFSLRLSLLPLNFLLGLLFWLLNLRLSLLLPFPLFMFLDVRSPSIFILSLPSQFLFLLWWRGLIFFDVPFFFSFS